MAALRLRGVGNRFLRPVDLEVPSGALFVLVGPSGAGKTSLLRILAGLSPHRGQILLDGREIGQLPPHRRGVGFLSQEPFLFPHLGLEANLEMGMTRLGWDRPRRRRRCRELLELLGIAHLAGRDTTNLSGGEKQRVALARVLASGPRLLLLDEPFNQLDFRTARHLRAEMKALQGRLGLTTLMVTHNLEEAHELADSLAVIHGGCLSEAGADPSGVHCFLETPNHLACGLVDALPQGLLELDWQGLRLFALDPGHPCADFRVRPSAIALGHTPPPGPSVNRFQARVAEVAILRDAAQVRCLVGGQCLRVEIPRGPWENAPLALGDAVHGFIPVDAIQSH